MRKSIVVVAGLCWLSMAGAAVAQGAGVKIGVLTDMSGALADTTGEGSVEAARMAADDFGGVVLGRKIEIVYADHQNKADIGAAMARRWFDNDAVGLAVDFSNSAVALAVQQLANEKGKIAIATGASSSEFTNKSCTPGSFQWGYDTYQFSKAAVPIVKSGGDTWFFVTADYAFGHALERDITKVIKDNGGKVVGSVRYPVNSMDYSSFLLQAQSSGAKVIGILSAVNDLQNILKQANDFQVGGDKQTISAPVLLLVDIHGVGIKATQGAIMSSVFYWDANDSTRAFSARFRKRFKNRPPTEAQAMTYSAVTHYLKAVREAGTEDTQAVLAKMRDMPVVDPTTPNPARIRGDGRVMRDISLVQVKTPGESKGDWDYFKILGPIAAEEAYRPVSESECPLLKQK